MVRIASRRSGPSIIASRGQVNDALRCCLSALHCAASVFRMSAGDSAPGSIFPWGFPRVWASWRSARRRAAEN